MRLFSFLFLCLYWFPIRVRSVPFDSAVVDDRTVLPPSPVVSVTPLVPHDRALVEYDAWRR